MLEIFYICKKDKSRLATKQYSVHTHMYDHTCIHVYIFISHHLNIHVVKIISIHINGSVGHSCCTSNHNVSRPTILLPVTSGDPAIRRKSCVPI